MNNFDIRTPEDLSGVIDTLLLNDKDMRMLSFVNFLKSNAVVTNTKHEFIDDSARIVETTAGAAWNSTDLVDLDIASADITQIRVGDQLVTPANEMVVVKSVDTSANTVDVYARGHGSTSPATVLNAGVLKIVGNAQIEDGDPIDSNAVSQSEVFNYTQIFDEVILLSGYNRRSRKV